MSSADALQLLGRCNWAEVVKTASAIEVAVTNDIPSKLQPLYQHEMKRGVLDRRYNCITFNIHPSL